MIVLRVLPWFIDTLQTIMNPRRIAKQRYENVIGEKELAVLKTDCLGTNQGVGLIACSVIIDTNLRGACTGRECGEKWRILRIR